jgi:hypothetical protein
VRAWAAAIPGHEASGDDPAATATPALRDCRYFIQSKKFAQFAGNAPNPRPVPLPKPWAKRIAVGQLFAKKSSVFKPLSGVTAMAQFLRFP